MKLSALKIGGWYATLYGIAICLSINSARSIRIRLTRTKEERTITARDILGEISPEKD